MRFGRFGLLYTVEADSGERISYGYSDLRGSSRLMSSGAVDPDQIRIQENRDKADRQGFATDRVSRDGATRNVFFLQTTEAAWESLN